MILQEKYRNVHKKHTIRLILECPLSMLNTFVYPTNSHIPVFQTKRKSLFQSSGYSKKTQDHPEPLELGSLRV